MDQKYKKLYENYEKTRRKWLDSDSTDFDIELGDLFDEIESLLDLPFGN